MKKGEGLRFNTGKNRLDLIPDWAEEQLGLIFTQGSLKYAPRNWESGMPWSNVLSSLKRHLNAFGKGEDRDKESGQYHMAHVAVNALFLLTYYRLFPQGDDRPHFYLDGPKVALDIDGVLANFGKAYTQELIKEGIEVREQFHWKFSYKDKKVWDRIVKDRDFWVNLEPLCDSHLPFEPVAYVSSRQIPTEWTEEWLEKNGFPCEPVYHVGKESKAEAIKATGADLFVDDNLDNFIELNKAGICTYLFDAPYNRKLNVGYKRITDLAELV